MGELPENGAAGAIFSHLWRELEPYFEYSIGSGSRLDIHDPLPMLFLVHPTTLSMNPPFDLGSAGFKGGGS